MIDESKFYEGSLKKSPEARKAHRLRELAGYSLSMAEVEQALKAGLEKETVSELSAKVAFLWYGLNGETPHTNQEIAQELDKPPSRVRDELNYAIRLVLASRTGSPDKQ